MIDEPAVGAASGAPASPDPAHAAAAHAASEAAGASAAAAREQALARLDALLTPDAMWRAKRLGFGDAQLAGLLHAPAAPITEADVRAWRRRHAIRPAYRMVDTCAGEFEARTPYFYGSYDPGENESIRSDRPKVVILGGGPNRIGQGIEFDYCCVQAIFALREAGIEAIMVNSNPETVSTDYDIADKLYIEPLTAEDVLNVLDLERPDGVLIQFGGQTPLKLARVLEAEGFPILGTPPDAIDLAEDRQRFSTLLRRLGIPQPRGATGRTPDEVAAHAARIGYPVLVRPSYVLGGRAMETVYDEARLREVIDGFAHHGEIDEDHPILVDEFVDGAIEVDVDAVADRTGACTLGAMMEHIELAGIHSGDSACVIPMRTASPIVAAAIRTATHTLARELGVVGLLNIQFAVKGERAMVLEVNPRASRTVPFVSKAIGRPLARLAVRAMLGETLAEVGFVRERVATHACVKEAVLPFNKFPEATVALGPEMKSTGEVMGIDAQFGVAFWKSQAAAGNPLPRAGCVLLSVRDEDKEALLPVARAFVALGFRLMATAGTQHALAAAGIEASTLLKRGEGRPDLVDAMINGEVQLVVNTVLGKKARFDEGIIRRTCLAHGIPIVTTIAAAQASAEAIEAERAHRVHPIALQDYHAALVARYQTSA